MIAKALEIKTKVIFHKQKMIVNVQLLVLNTEEKPLKECNEPKDNTYLLNPWSNVILE